MTRLYARTREREKAWKLGGYAAGGSLIAAPIMGLIFNGWSGLKITELMWTFSIVLESVCVLPQLLLLRQTNVPTVIDTFYLLTLGSYRAFYILNWIVRLFSAHKPEPISVIFGIIQTAFYADFAWVYWTRQRVKLRGGAVVDADDLQKGWLVNRVVDAVGRPSTEVDEEAGFEPADIQTNGNGNIHAPNSASNRWGARGISISADDTLHDHNKVGKGRTTAGFTDNAQAESTGILDDDDVFGSDDDDDAPVLDDPGKKVLNSDQEWRSDEETGK